MNEEKISFEQAFEKLRLASENMDRTDITLDQAMKNYEDGIKYYKICRSILDDAKQKIEMFESENMLFNETEKGE